MFLNSQLPIFEKGKRETFWIRQKENAKCYIPHHRFFLLQCKNIRGALDLAILEYSAYASIATKTSKTGHFGVLRNKSSDANISTHTGSAPPSSFGTGHVTVLSTPPPNTEYSDVRQHRCSSTLDLCSACSEWKE